MLGIGFPCSTEPYLLTSGRRYRYYDGRNKQNSHDDEGKNPLERNGLSEELRNTYGC